MKIGVIGAGGWGTALACVVAENNHDVYLWSREESVAQEIQLNRTNSTYLNGIDIHESVVATHNPADLSAVDILVNAIPTQYIRPTLLESGFDCTNKIIVNCSKGIEQTTQLRVSQIFRSVASVHTDMFAVLTGPSHAEEVGRKIPTTVVVASTEAEIAKTVQKIFTTSTFRVYSSYDVVGAEIGGALKNVIAIAAGIIDGAGMGDNTKAALMTRGLAEITRLGVKLGANPFTFSGLSGLGDLIVTCDSRHSRNRKVGEKIGRGATLSQVLASMNMVAEGVPTTKSAKALADHLGIEMPIVDQVYEILFSNKPPLKAIHDLMVRDSKDEHDM